MKKLIDNETGTEIILNAALAGTTYHDEVAVDSIKNKTLKSNVKSYLQSERRGKKAAWEMVRLLASMSEHIKEDFGSDYAFAEFMECSQSIINKRKRLGLYAVELEKAGYSDSQAMEFLPLLSTAERKMVDVYSDDIESLEVNRGYIVDDLSNNIPVTLSQKEIRKVVKQLTAYISEERVEIGYFIEAKDNANEEIAMENTIGEGENLESYDDTEPDNQESYIQYTLPWLRDGGLVDETLQVSEEIALELAKAIMEIINKYE